MRILAKALPLLIFSSTAAASTSLTLYSTTSTGTHTNYSNRPMSYDMGWARSLPGYAIVQDSFELNLTEGRNTTPYTNITAYLDPATVTFDSLTDPNGTRLIDQSYQFDLINNQNLLQKFLGKEITVEQNNGNQIETITGKLLNAQNGLVLENKQGEVFSLSHYSKVRFSQLPDNVSIKPTLIWTIQAEKSGKHSVKTSYQSYGFTWWANYNALYKETDTHSGTLELGAWANIVNQSGKDFEEVNLKLISGQVNQTQTANGPVYRMAMMSKVAEDAQGGFEEKTFSEYHLYTLPEKTTLLDDSTKQIALFPSKTDIPVKKEYFYEDNRHLRYGGYVNRNQNPEKEFPGSVITYLSFKNDEASGLGIPLPAGNLRVNQQDPKTGSFEFIGEDLLNHTPKGEEVQIKIGNAYDIVGYKKQTGFTIDNQRKYMQESFEITLKNRKNTSVNVTIKEILYRSANWSITNASLPYTKINAQTLYFPVTLKKDEEIKLHYTVEYTW